MPRRTSLLLCELPAKELWKLACGSATRVCPPRTTQPKRFDLLRGISGYLTKKTRMNDKKERKGHTSHDDEEKNENLEDAQSLIGMFMSHESK